MDYLMDCLFGGNLKNKDKEKNENNDILSPFDRTPPRSPTVKSPSGIQFIPKDEVTRTFNSPKGVVGNNIDEHTKRLNERGYEVKSLLGKGTFGQCYDVIKSSDGSRLAVKIMNLGEFQKDDKLFQDFSNEVWILSQTPHINIIGLVDHFMYDGMYTFIVLEFANGETLDKWVKNSSAPLTEYKAKIYFFQMSRAIDHLHRQGIAHRDIKLNNTLVHTLSNGKQVIKVADFGLSRVSYKSNYGTVMMSKPVGTMVFMSPQVLILYTARLTKTPLVGQRVEPFSADIWSLGICLYFMLDQRYPFEDTDQFRYGNKKDKQVKAIVSRKMYKKMIRHEWTLPQQNLSKECHHLLEDTLEVNCDKRIQISGIVRNMWFDEWLNGEKVVDINQIDLLKFLDKYD